MGNLAKMMGKMTAGEQLPGPGAMPSTGSPFGNKTPAMGADPVVGSATERMLGASNPSMSEDDKRKARQMMAMDLMKASQGGLFQGQDLQSTFLGRRR